MEEKTYSIVLTLEELAYLRNALDTRIEDAPASEHLLLTVESHEQGLLVTVNQAAYDLIHYLRFGGSSFVKDWMRNEAVV